MEWVVSQTESWWGLVESVGQILSPLSWFVARSGKVSVRNSQSINKALVCESFTGVLEVPYMIVCTHVSAHLEPFVNVANYQGLTRTPYGCLPESTEGDFKKLPNSDSQRHKQRGYGIIIS